MLGFFLGLRAVYQHEITLGLTTLLSRLDDFKCRTFFSLLALGTYGGGARELSQSFKNLGALHLLVLSGSQVSSFRKVWEKLPSLWGWRPGFENTLRKYFLGAGLVAFAAVVPMDPPIVRALLMEGLLVSAPRLATTTLIVFTLALQLILFPEHAFKMGFYLSWMCWALMGLSALVPSKTVKALILTLSCQGAAIFLTGSVTPGPRTWLLLLVANMILLNLFEKCLFPLCAVLLSLVIALSPVALVTASWSLLGTVGGFLGPILNGSGALVLVALRAFRYIQ